MALAGYSVSYLGGDHHVQTISVDVTCAIRDTELGRGVVVEVSALLRDDGGNSFTGWVDYVLFVDLADRPQPPIVIQPTRPNIA